MERNAIEFISSVRGVRRTRNAIQVSTIYAEAKILFPDWDKDLRTHLLEYANVLARPVLQEQLPLEVTGRYRKIADLAGGVTVASGFQVQMNDGFSDGLESTGSYLRFPTSSIPITAQNFLQARNEKRRRIARQKHHPLYGSQGIVTIIDVETEDLGARDSEQETEE